MGNLSGKLDAIFLLDHNLRISPTPDAAVPGIEFLEYLGSWQADDDEVWALAEWDKDNAADRDKDRSRNDRQSDDEKAEADDEDRDDDDDAESQ